MNSASGMGVASLSQTYGGPAEETISDTSLGQAKAGSGDLVLSQLEKLVEDVRVPVDVFPWSGTNLTNDWWGAQIYELHISGADLGLDAALMSLASQVAGAVPELLADRLVNGGPQIGLLLRLWLAERDGSLGRLIMQSARFAGCDDPLND